MSKLDVFGNVNHTERKVPRFDDPNLGRPVTIPPMGPEMTHYQGDQPVEPYSGAFEPPPKKDSPIEDVAPPNYGNKNPFSSVIDRAVKNSPPPLDDVGGLEDELFDPLDPDLAAIKALVQPKNTAADMLKIAAAVVEGKRAEQHGPKERNHENIAMLWNAYMELKRLNAPLVSRAHIFDAWDVAQLMELLKLARRFAGTGRTNPDNYIDGAGYCGLAGEIALNGGEVKDV